MQKPILVVCLLAAVLTAGQVSAQRVEPACNPPGGPPGNTWVSGNIVAHPEKIEPATSSHPRRVFYHIYATDGYIQMPDGSQHYIFGFTDKPVQGEATLPAPTIVADEGDAVYVTMTNLGFKYRPDITDPHTIHLHGIHVIPYFDGFPESSFSVPMGESYRYFFRAEHPGTFMYHCQVEAAEHVTMGMYGPLIIYPKMGRNYAYNDRKTKFDKEYVLLFSELDSRWHYSLENPSFSPEIPQALWTDPKNGPPNFGDWVRVNFRPDYWMINGRAFPDTVCTSPDLPGQLYQSQPMNSLISAKGNQKVLLRFIHMGYQDHPIHAQGVHLTEIAADSELLSDPLVKFTVPIHSGETYDIMVNFDLKQFNQTMPPGSDIPEGAELGPFFSGSPFLKEGAWYWPIHCHDDFHVTNNGTYPGGMMTLFKLTQN